MSKQECISCHKDSDNANFNCPVKGDYRLFTDWRPRCSTQYYDMITNQLPDALTYRMYLTHNAEELITRNAKTAYLKASCGPCVDNPNWNTGTMLPELDKQTCNARSCSFRPNDPWGLGRGREYFSDDFDKKVREEFIKQKEKENEFFKSATNCCGTKTDELYYYPIDGNIQQENTRPSNPSGRKLF